MQDYNSILLEIQIHTDFEITDAKRQAAFQVAEGYQSIEQVLIQLGADIA
jgi:hypothetical protein